ncbi:MAG: type II secretion system secretin GspD, partial [Thermodesulfobacteriota bacterium]
IVLLWTGCGTIPNESLKKLPLNGVAEASVYEIKPTVSLSETDSTQELSGVIADSNDKADLKEAESDLNIFTEEVSDLTGALQSQSNYGNLSLMSEKKLKENNLIASRHNLSGSSNHLTAGSPNVSEGLHPRDQIPARKRPASREGLAVQTGKDVVLNFDNADIYEVIKTLADILEINYIIDPAVKGTVNIHTTGKISKKDIFNIFQTILKVNGATFVKEGELYHFIPTQSAKTRLLIPQVGLEKIKISPYDKIALQVVKLRFIGADEAANALRPFLTPGADLTVYKKNNLILITDFHTNLEKLLKIVEILDINLFKEVTLKLYPIQEADVQEIGQEMQKIFAALEVSATSGRGAGINFIPIKRINALLVVSSLPYVFEEVEKWLVELDRKETIDEVRTFIYHVKNGIAGELADILNAIFTNDRKKVTTAARRTEPFIKGAVPGQVKAQKAAKTTNRQPPGAISGDVKFIPYATTNTIIIKSTPRDYRVITEILEKLDILQRQVLIEILIAELTLTDENTFGIEFTVQGGDTTGDVRELLLGTSLGLTQAGVLASGGLTASVVGSDILATINALASENRVNVLASPQIIASDGKEASIDIGDEVPLVASKILIDNREELVIERRNTGVILKVKPHINTTGLVTLDISLELSNAAKTVVAGESDIRIFKRSVKTTMVVQDKQTIIIGGLIDEKIEKVSTKVPLLGDIPLFGLLFRSKKDSLKKTELILLITPHVIHSLNDATDVTGEFIEKLKKLRRHLNEREGGSPLPSI